MATRTKRSQKPIFEYQKPAIEAAAKTRKVLADAWIANKVKRELTATEQKRANKLQEVISDLENDRHVQNRKLQTWLSADEFAMIDAEWQQEQTHRSIYKDKPKLVQEYEAKVAKADFFFNRSEHFSLNGKGAQAKKLWHLAESTYEKALERLEEIIEQHPELQIWFDRETQSSVDNDTSIDPDSIPRVVTSRSPKCRHNLSTRTIRDIKLGVAQDALRNLLYTSKDDPSTSSSSAKLEALLRLPDDGLI